ncbi:MAG: TlyA family RNA methyltransferase [Oscillospiraceae bacterium]|jgi:23S rRNA (cytidine1920-2'-O)/16S rRNA (cytidine1409-2'-O)-methyltransferase|nr:TlyA family RNA methyltransferase [Oscillospiraceae bacterium]
MRLDLWLVARAHFPTRAKAQAAIAAGQVSVNGQPCTKCGLAVTTETQIDVAQTAAPLVGRGGEKLRHARTAFSLDVQDLVCLDVGASTGGFTQVLLEAGARRVYALDVGHDQLDATLRRDARVVNLEGCNFRYFTPADLPETPQFACVDVSFISLRLILPPLAACLPRGAHAVVLVKPQFEAGRAALNKQGVVTDAKTRARALADVTAFAQETGFAACATCDSPILGGQGNREFLLHLLRD